MRTVVTMTTAVPGSGKGPEGHSIDRTGATGHFDHPGHAAMDHAPIARG